MDSGEFEKMKDLDPVNRELLEAYTHHLKNKNLKETSIGIKQWKVYFFLKFTGFKDARQATQKEIEAYYHHRRDSKSPFTVQGDILELRLFLAWLLPKKVKILFSDLKPKKVKRDLPTDQVITQDDVSRIIKACETQRDRALIALLWDSGARLDEITSLNVGHIQLDKYGATCVVDGKTGRRRLRLVSSVPDLHLWMNIHPFKEDNAAPLFPAFRRPGQMVRLSHRTVQGLFHMLAKRAGIQKRIHPHGFRHGRMTELARDFTEPELCQMAGWAKGSQMPATYVHLSMRDTETKILRRAGLLEADEMEPDDPLKPRRCPRCHHENPHDTWFCLRCSMVLNLKAANAEDLALAEIRDTPLYKAIMADLKSG